MRLPTSILGRRHQQTAEYTMTVRDNTGLDAATLSQLPESVDLLLLREA